jgi:exopolyphosphatase/guanosine-5'-triphosphate,3'-diphosphate pyrophosphatase
MLVARVLDGRLDPIASSSTMTALGEGLERTGGIAAHALDLAEATVAAMAAEARALGATAPMIACTAVAREAGNAADLLARLERASGVTPRVLTGAQEATLTFAGLGTAETPPDFVAADLGGGSLELMGGRDGVLRWVTSLPVGVRKMTERYEPTDPPALDLLGPMSAFARQVIEPVAAEHPAAGAVATGGSAVALGVLAATPRLDRDALVRAVEVLASAPAEDVAADTGLEPARLRLCLAGAAVLEAVRRAFGVEALQVSAAGLREGLVMEAAGGR